jgi:hypothetical protein
LVGTIYQNGPNKPNKRKIYKIAQPHKKLIQNIPDGCETYQKFPFQGLPKYIYNQTKIPSGNPVHNTGEPL